MPTRVLIVEDDADINQIVATHLARCGFACTQAFSGSEAKLLLADATNSFDVVLSDLMLPGLSGEELVSLVRARDARVPIIVISARTTTSPSRSTLTSSWRASGSSCAIGGFPRKAEVPPVTARQMGAERLGTAWRIRAQPVTQRRTAQQA